MVYPKLFMPFIWSGLLSKQNISFSQRAAQPWQVQARARNASYPSHMAEKFIMRVQGFLHQPPATHGAQQRLMVMETTSVDRYYINMMKLYTLQHYRLSLFPLIGQLGRLQLRMPNREWLVEWRRRTAGQK